MALYGNSTNNPEYTKFLKSFDKESDYEKFIREKYEPKQRPVEVIDDDDFSFFYHDMVACGGNCNWTLEYIKNHPNITLRELMQVVVKNGKFQ